MQHNDIHVLQLDIVTFCSILHFLISRRRSLMSYYSEFSFFSSMCTLTKECGFDHVCSWSLIRLIRKDLPRWFLNDVDVFNDNLARSESLQSFRCPKAIAKDDSRTRQNKTWNYDATQLAWQHSDWPSYFCQQSRLLRYWFTTCMHHTSTLQRSFTQRTDSKSYQLAFYGYSKLIIYHNGTCNWFNIMQL